MTNRQYGVVKWFQDEKGYGFIAREGKTDLFVHHSEIEGMTGRRTLEAKQHVSFVEGTGKKGAEAKSVRCVVEETSIGDREVDDVSDCVD